MNVLIILGQIVTAFIIILLIVLLTLGLLAEVTQYIQVKTLEKRRSVMLDIIEEEIITQADTQPDKVNAPDIVIQLNRRMNIKKFTQTDILHMTITTLKSLKLKGII
jgi:hypothetical protein